MIGQFFTALLAKFGSALTWIGNLFKGVFVSLWHVVTDVFCWVFEGFLKILQGVLDALPGTQAFSLLNPAQYINGMSADMVNMIGLVRVGEGLAIILAAIAVKLVLQVIPFTRLGS